MWLIALSKLLPGHIVYFIPYSVIPPGEEDGPHRARIDAINLALILEIFLPASTREKYPDLTMRIPYIDGSDIVPSSQSFSHLSIGSQTSFGMSQASQPLTQEERVIQIVDPLAELRIVYLQLCAGRTESHVKFVIRAILLVISCVVSGFLLMRPGHVERSCVLRSTYRFRPALTLVLLIISISKLCKATY